MKLSNLSNRGIFAILLALAFVSSVVSVFLNTDSLSSWAVSLLQNFCTEMIGAFLTFGLIQVILGVRQEKERLISDLGSRVSDVARRAAEELKARGWLQDGSLRRAKLPGAILNGVDLDHADLLEVYLTGAKLQKVKLSQANLTETMFFMADLQGAGMSYSNLQRANLYGANLREAILFGADLQEVDLSLATLQNADLRETHLQRANLTNANLYHANLDRSQFDIETLLPDGSKWNSDTDMTRFTDPKHRDFWRPVYSLPMWERATVD